MQSKLNLGQSLKTGLLAALFAAVINAILFFVFHAAGVFTDDIFIQPNEPLTIVPVLISSIFPTLVGALVFFIFEKFSNNGFKIFRIFTLVILVLSLSSPFMGIKGVTPAYAIVLCVMHVSVVFLLLYQIKKSKDKLAS